MKDDAPERPLQMLYRALDSATGSAEVLKKVVAYVEAERAAALSVLSVPAAVVDRECCLLGHNQLFEQVLERDALRVGSEDRVSTSRPVLTGRLRDNVRAIVDGAADQPSPDGISELYVVLDARPHYQMIIVASGVDCADAAKSRVLLTVYLPDADHHIDDDLLERLYNFTPTEAQTAARLAEGYTIDEIADFRRCAKSTVRTHVKRVLKKTGTHRQVELVRVILSSPAAKLAT